MSKFSGSSSGIDALVASSFRAIEEGAYDFKESRIHDVLSLRRAIAFARRAALITEIKFASPSRGKIREQSSGPEQIAISMASSGAIALSVLTQPNFFEGSLDFLARVRRSVPIPILMKDIVVSKIQIEAARKVGTDCVLLIKSVFDKNLAENDLATLYDFSRSRGLEVILEVHSEMEYYDALSEGYDVVGINNRNLETLAIDISTTERLLAKHGKGRSTIISESGISTAHQIRNLRKAGADAFLVGTSIMESEDVALKVRQLSEAI